MTSRTELDSQALLDATRRVLVACADGIDVSAVQPETPLAVLLFDSLMAAKFTAALEADLGVSDLPFERWFAEHSERTETLTIGSLIDWLRRLAEMRPAGAMDRGAAAKDRGPEQR